MSASRRVFRRSLACIAAVLLWAGSLALAASQQESAREIVIATGSRGGSYYPMGQRIAALLSSRIPALSVRVVETSGGVENLQLLGEGKATFGFVNASTAWDAVAGLQSFSAGRVPVRSVAAISPNTVHLVARADAGIKSVRDLGGHRVSVGAPNSGTQVIADRILSVFEQDFPAGVKPVSLGLQDSVAALERGEIDAFFFGASTPVSAIEKAFAGRKAAFSLVDCSGVSRKLNQRYGPLYREGEIPANTYVGQRGGVKAVEVWDLLVTLETTDGKLVYDLAKALFEGRAELVSGMKGFERLDMATQDKNSVISLHPGAQRALAEKGIQPFARQIGFIR